MKGELLPKEVAETLPPLCTYENTPAKRVPVPVKLFMPGMGWTWYLTEYDPESRVAFGYVKGMCAELGHINITEIEETVGSYGHAERDEHWNPETTLAQVMEGE